MALFDVLLSDEDVFLRSDHSKDQYFVGISTTPILYFSNSGYSNPSACVAQRSEQQWNTYSRDSTGGGTAQDNQTRGYNTGKARRTEPNMPEHGLTLTVPSVGLWAASTAHSA